MTLCDLKLEASSCHRFPTFNNFSRKPLISFLMFFYLHVEDQNGYKVTKRDFLSKFMFTKFLVEKVKSGTKLPKNGLFGIFFKKI